MVKDSGKIYFIPKRKNFVFRVKTRRNSALSAWFYGLGFSLIFSFFLIYNGLSIDGKRTAKLTTNIADYLNNRVRVFCMVMTSPDGLHQRGHIIMDTWGKRCNKLIFFCEQPNDSFDNVVVIEESNQLIRTRKAFEYVHDNHMHEFDWLLRTNDDSFVLMENLRHMLFQYDTDWPVVIGQRYLKENFMIGSTAVSKRALKRLINEAFVNPEICETYIGDTDIEISRCLQHVNVLQVDGIDENGQGRFFQNTQLEGALYPERFDEYDKRYWHKLKQGIGNCCSHRLIAIQGYGNEHCYYMEYFIYKVHAFGRHRRPEPLPRRFTLEEVVKSSV